MFQNVPSEEEIAKLLQSFRVRQIRFTKERERGTKLIKEMMNECEGRNYEINC